MALGGEGAIAGTMCDEFADEGAALGKLGTDGETGGYP